MNMTLSLVNMSMKLIKMKYKSHYWIGIWLKNSINPTSIVMLIKVIFILIIIIIIIIVI